MANLIWTEPALQDIEEIAEYIALDDHEAAKKLVKKNFTTVERLKNHPQSGKKSKELKKTIYREIIVRPCRIFYRIEKNKVFILYVMRGERDLRKYILEERSKKMDLKD